MNVEKQARAFFVGRPYLDQIFKVDHIPTGDEKVLARDFVLSLGGNAVMAGLCCNKLGMPVHILTTHASDDFGLLVVKKLGENGVSFSPRAVKTTATSVIFPNGGMRAMVRHYDKDFLEAFPHLEIDDYRIAHFDGHQPDAAIHYAHLCRQKKIPTSFDGGSLRENTRELLGYIDIAVVSERLCEQMHLDTKAMLDYLRRKGCMVGAVTMGELGVDWYCRDAENMHLDAVEVPSEKVIDTNGAGDTFHGAYIYSYLAHPDLCWEFHFRFAAAASAHAIQYLGNEQGLPALANVMAILNGRPQLVASA